MREEGGGGGGGVYLELYRHAARLLTRWDEHAVAQEWAREGGSMSGFGISLNVVYAVERV